MEELRRLAPSLIVAVAILAHACAGRYEISGVGDNPVRIDRLTGAICIPLIKGGADELRTLREHGVRMCD